VLAAGAAGRADSLATAGATGATPRPLVASLAAACSAGEICGPETSWRIESSPPKPPAPTSTTTSAATIAAGTSAAAVPALSSWRSHAPTRSIRR